MKFIKLFSVALCSILLLSGCIYVSGNHDGVVVSHGDDRLRSNKEKISLLDIGVTREDVIENIGKPDASEASSVDDSDYYILYYITEYSKSDKTSIIENSTPLVFKDNLLIGWGHDVLEKVN